MNDPDNSDPNAAAVQRIAWIYETITSKYPDRDETEELVGLLDELKRHYKANEKLARELCSAMIPPKTDRQTELTASPNLAAWTMLVSAIYNLDISKTRE